MRPILPIKSWFSLPLFCLGLLLFIPVSAQPIPAFPLRFQSVLPGKENSAARQIIRQLSGKDCSGFSLKESILKNPVFKVYQLLYQGIELHNAYLISHQVPGGQIEFLAPDFSDISLPVPDDKAGKTLVFNGISWEQMSISRETSLSPPAAFLHFSDKFGRRLFQEDWLLRFSDSSVKARVFRPDPVSRLQIPYGGQLRDRSDSSSSLLRQAMDSLQLRIRFDGDSFRLESPYLHFGEFSPPAKPLSISVSADSFYFDRHQAGFEEVNAFYHLSRFREFLDSAGMDSLARFPLQVDAHGLDGADQSAYSPLQEFLAFGDGNVDDAEDAAVILHEYGHALAHAAFPFGNSGQERRAIEEGICDYLAGSYLRSVSSYLPDRLFRWDGNNEFWPGRSLVTSKMYPGDLSGSLYADGEIFCAALSSMEPAIGRKDMHRILLSALYGMGPNLTMPAAARLLLVADSALFQGQHSSQIRFHFLERGIDPELVVVSYPKPIMPARGIFYSDGYRPFFRSELPDGTTFKILDALGRVRLEPSVLSGPVQEIPVEMLEPGMYILQAGSDFYRFLVQRPR